MRRLLTGRDEDQAAVEAKVAAQSVGVSSTTRDAGCVATRSKKNPGKRSKKGG